MDWKQIADQLHDALRDLYENGANCPDDKVLRARDAYDAACTETDGQTHWDGCYESHYDCAIARVEELERELAAFREAYIQVRIAQYIGWGMKIERARLHADTDANILLAELLKENERAKSN